MMMYLVAIFLFICGYLFILSAQMAKDRIKDIKDLLEDEKNKQEVEGSLRVIEIRSTQHTFECDCEVIFIDHKNKEIKENKTFFISDSDVSFLRKCENKGAVSVNVVYDKNSPSRNIIKELKHLESSKNSIISYTVTGILFIVLVFFCFRF